MNSNDLRVVLQFGKHSIKAGICGDCLPRTIQLSPFLRKCRGSKLVTETLEKNEWELFLRPVLRVIYFERLKITPCEYPVLMLEHEYMASKLREAIASILLDEFCVPSIFYMSEMSAPLYLTGVGTGLVIDVGYYTTRVLPVAHECLIRKAYQEINLGSFDVNQVLQQELRIQTAVEEDIPENVLDNIKIGACYVRCEKEDDKFFDLYSSQDVTYKINKKESDNLSKPSIRVFGKKKCELSLFNRSLKMTFFELRPQILNNVILCGGASQIKGFMYRFAYEFKKRLDIEFPKIASNLKIYDSVCPELCRQWTGGSLCCATIRLPPKSDYEIDLHQRSQGKRLPDWITDSLIALTDDMMKT